MKKSVIALLLAMTMTATFAGCASSGEDNASADANADVNDQAEPLDGASDTQEKAEDDLQGEGALADGVLNVGTNAEFPPFEFVGDDGEPDGFDMALIKAIGEKIGVDVQVENMEFDSLVMSIGSKIDVAIAGMTVTDERKEMVDFSDEYYEAVQYIIVPADSEIASVADLEGKHIGVQLGTTGDIIVGDTIKDAIAGQYNKAVDAVNDLLNGRLDAVIVDKNPAKVFGEQYKDELKLLDGESEAFGFEKEYYAIALPKGDTELAEKINDALAELKDDGTFDELVSQYIEN